MILPPLAKKALKIGGVTHGVKTINGGIMPNAVAK